MPEIHAEKFVNTALKDTISKSNSPWTKTPECYQTQLRAVLSTYIQRHKSATGSTLGQIASQLEWGHGNHLTQLTKPKYNAVLSPASILPMAKALNLTEKEIDKFVIIAMRANSDRTSKMSPELMARYDKALVRMILAKTKKRGISFS